MADTKAHWFCADVYHVDFRNRKKGQLTTAVHVILCGHGPLLLLSCTVKSRRRLRPCSPEIPKAGGQKRLVCAVRGRTLVQCRLDPWVLLACQKHWIAPHLPKPVTPAAVPAFMSQTPVEVFLSAFLILTVRRAVLCLIERGRTSRPEVGIVRQVGSRVTSLAISSTSIHNSLWAQYVLQIPQHMPSCPVLPGKDPFQFVSVRPLRHRRRSLYPPPPQIMLG